MAELSRYLCQMQLQLQVAHGAQFMALAQIQMIAVDILFRGLLLGPAQLGTRTAQCDVVLDDEMVFEK